MFSFILVAYTSPYFTFNRSKPSPYTPMTELWGNESVRVYIFHHPEYFYRLAFVGKDDQYLHVVFTVPADTVEYRYTAMGFFGDAVGNLFIFFGENKELNRLRVLLTM